MLLPHPHCFQESQFPYMDYRKSTSLVLLPLAFSILFILHSAARVMNRQLGQDLLDHLFKTSQISTLRFSGGSGDASFIPGSRRSWGGNGNSLQCSCLGKPVDRRAWWAIVRKVTESQTWLSDSACMCLCLRKTTFPTFIHYSIKSFR